MSQTPDEKAAAIASVLWLLPDHYSMIIIGRTGVHFRNELDAPEGWTPPIPEQFEGWPLEEILRFFDYQRYLSAKYRLWAVGRAWQKLIKVHRDQAVAVSAQWIECPPPNWYEPERGRARAKAGLRFMAKDVLDDVPFFQERVVEARPPNKVARDQRIREMLTEGISTRRIARELRCSLTTVKALKHGLAVRQGSTVSAEG